MTNELRCKIIAALAQAIQDGVDLPPIAISIHGKDWPRERENRADRIFIEQNLGACIQEETQIPNEKLKEDKIVDVLSGICEELYKIRNSLHAIG